MQDIGELPRNGGGLADIGCDGIELFTLFEKVPAVYAGISPSVHLPYAIDWFTAWNGTIDTAEFDEKNVKYMIYGRDREEIVTNIRSAIEYASEIRPAYGTFHASCTNLDEVMLRKQKDNSREVLKAFCEMINQTVSLFRNNEPPFRLAFENLWWSGLKLLDPWEYKFLDTHLEFDNWGFCLDTGHMMNTLPDAYEEDTCVKRLLEIFGKYPDEMRDRIKTMHLHVSTSAEYRKTFKEEPRPPEEKMTSTVERVYSHISKIDQHRPFSKNGCRLLVDAISPDYVTHEMSGTSTEQAIKNFIQQRAHFP